MREYIECVRTMWTGSPVNPVSYSGDFYRVRDYRRFMPAPADPPPIYLAAVQSRMLQLAGSHTDGWISGPLNSVQYLTTVAQPNLLQGMAAAGRSPSTFQRCVMKPCVVHQDAKRARALARNAIAVYGTLPYYDVVLDPLGFTQATRAIRAAAQRGDVAGMLDAVTDDMLDALVLAGTVDDVHRQLAPWEGHLDLLILYCPPGLSMEPAETRAIHEGIIAAFGT
jgi:alkanesulfonate monooxygenase SsuD/methylene tetrahydromethanopterin reductase-like flavin-dependent oxidoreductase (luciferase family)